jgi:hypothetical protein
MPSIIDVVDNDGKQNYIENLLPSNSVLCDENDKNYGLQFDINLNDEFEFSIYFVPRQEYQEYVKHCYHGCTVCNGYITIIEKKNYSIKEILENIHIS